MSRIIRVIHRAMVIDPEIADSYHRAYLILSESEKCMTVKELAAKLGLSLSRTYGIVYTLRDWGYVEF